MRVGRHGGITLVTLTLFKLIIDKAARAIPAASSRQPIHIGDLASCLALTILV